MAFTATLRVDRRLILVVIFCRVGSYSLYDDHEIKCVFHIAETSRIDHIGLLQRFNI